MQLFSIEMCATRHIDKKLYHSTQHGSHVITTFNGLPLRDEPRYEYKNLKQKRIT